MNKKYREIFSIERRIVINNKVLKFKIRQKLLEHFEVWRIIQQGRISPRDPTVFWFIFVKNKRFSNKIIFLHQRNLLWKIPSRWTDKNQWLLVISFTEFFCYDYWYEILEKLMNLCGYIPPLVYFAFQYK